MKSEGVFRSVLFTTNSEFFGAFIHPARNSDFFNLFDLAGRLIIDNINKAQGERQRQKERNYHVEPVRGYTPGSLWGTSLNKMGNKMSGHRGPLGPSSLWNGVLMVDKRARKEGLSSWNILAKSKIMPTPVVCLHVPAFMKNWVHCIQNVAPTCSARSIGEGKTHLTILAERIASKNEAENLREIKDNRKSCPRIPGLVSLQLAVPKSSVLRLNPKPRYFLPASIFQGLPDFLENTGPYLCPGRVSNIAQL